jgi:hypothetical protein
MNPARFGIDPIIHNFRLKEQIDGWFITFTARNSALQEQKLRALSLEGDLTAGVISGLRLMRIERLGL